MKSFNIFSIVLLLVVLTIDCTVHALNRTRDCHCRIDVNNRIVGGKVASDQSFPWQASLGISKAPTNNTPQVKQKLGTHMCGAVVLNENWILTAAHCVLDYSSYRQKAKNPKDVAIGVGHNHDLIQIYDQGRILAKQVLIKPNYVSRLASSPNDLALIELERPLTFSDGIAPACLSNHHTVPYPHKLVATGWGSVNRMEVNLITGQWSGYEASRYLKEADFDDTTLTTSSCSNRRDLICISPTAGEEKSSCKGDSGGPLHYTEKGKTYVVGATSFGPSRIKDFLKYETCIGTAAYTRLSYHMDWIKSNAGEICDF